MTKVKRPKSNAFTEGPPLSLLDEHFRLTGRKKWYYIIQEMQADLDAYLASTAPTGPTRAGA